MSLRGEHESMAGHFMSAVELNYRIKVGGYVKYKHTNSEQTHGTYEFSYLCYTDGLISGSLFVSVLLSALYENLFVETLESVTRLSFRTVTSQRE